jgi:hypothetical protein
VGLDSGLIDLYNKPYYYFYLIPGFPIEYNASYEIFIDDKLIKLKNYLDPVYTAKIINGLFILPNNFNYAFNHTSLAITMYNNRNIFTHILKQENKYSYYMPNTNNTILHVLDTKNINLLSTIGNGLQDLYIRPLFNRNYSLGSCNISIEGVDNCRILFGNNISIFKDTINIGYLPAGQYKVAFLDDKDNPITITSVNGNIIDQDSFHIKIDRRLLSNQTQTSLLSKDILDKPSPEYSNLTINLTPHNTSFELFGPNNFYRSFKKGFQQLHNIIPGEYNIKYKNITKTILVIKNDNNYFSNL